MAHNGDSMFKKKIFIPLPKLAVGGPTTFLLNLAKYLDQKNVEITNNINHSDLLFYPISHSFLDQIVAKSRSIPIIQRLDGLYYPERNGKLYFKKNIKAGLSYYVFSDHKIFQSEFSKKQCFSTFSPITQNKYTTIINGANRELYYPDNLTPADLGKHIRFITTGNFRHRDMLEPIIKALDQLSGLEFTLQIVGPTTENINDLLDRKYITKLGTKKPSEIADLLRQSDIYLFSALNSACPNTLIEAVSCAIPIVGFASGGAKEICFFNKEIMIPTSNHLLDTENDLCPKEMHDKIQLCLENYRRHKTIAIENSDKYGFEKTGQQYLDLFEKQLIEFKSNS